jgi:transcriptional regulator with XRE-family HTH domain
MPVNPVDLALQKLDCTASDFAKRMGVSPALVSMWKQRGYITQKHLIKACQVTGLDAHLLNPYFPAAKHGRRNTTK